MKFLPLALAILLPALSGCTTAPSEVPADPSYATDVQPILNNGCITCHGDAAPSGGYSLTSRSGAVGGGSDTVPNVVPNSASSSKLYRRISGAETPQMPAGQPPLAAIRRYRASAPRSFT